MNKSILSKTSEMKIGNMTYIVTSHYQENGRETAEDKLFRLVCNRISGDKKAVKSHGIK